MVNEILKKYGEDVHMTISEYWYEADGSIAIPLINSSSERLGTIWFEQDEKLKQLEQKYLSFYTNLDKSAPLRYTEQKDLFKIKNKIFDYFKVYLKQENMIRVELL